MQQIHGQRCLEADNVSRPGINFYTIRRIYKRDLTHLLFFIPLIVSLENCALVQGQRFSKLTMFQHIRGFHDSPIFIWGIDDFIFKKASLCISRSMAIITFIPGLRNQWNDQIFSL